jgi:hypothetical protein
LAQALAQPLLETARALGLGRGGMLQLARKSDGGRAIGAP